MPRHVVKFQEWPIPQYYIFIYSGKMDMTKKCYVFLGKCTSLLPLALGKICLAMFISQLRQNLRDKHCWRELKQHASTTAIGKIKFAFAINGYFYHLKISKTRKNGFNSYLKIVFVHNFLVSSLKSLKLFFSFMKLEHYIYNK